jgi:hypothetical protein
LEREAVTLTILRISNAQKPITFSEQDAHNRVAILEQGWPIGSIVRASRNPRTINSYFWTITMESGDPVVVCPSLRKAKSTVLRSYGATDAGDRQPRNFDEDGLTPAAR